jgi:hypothetical protein
MPHPAKTATWYLLIQNSCQHVDYAGSFLGDSGAGGRILLIRGNKSTMCDTGQYFLAVFG